MNKKDRKVTSLEELSESQLSEICGGGLIDKIGGIGKLVKEIKKAKKVVAEVSGPAPCPPPPGSSGTGGTSNQNCDSSYVD